ncbi:MAG: hypothetical protein HGA78_00795 [Nitrospirales bacterium]|nr:hypothetical protein [Nitrospirales bacterium]
MTYTFRSRFGPHLYSTLPEVYRSRDRQDGDEHLARYLDSFGGLLDSVYNTLDQRFNDCFPETCQEWLLPYFAQLLDVTLLSPLVEGRRSEVAQAISWRKGKGTLNTAQEIAMAVGGLEGLEIREGWKQVARTARIGEPGSAVTVNLHNTAPVFSGHKDTSLRTVDVRTPDWRQGHYHPRTLLLYTPPPEGFFALPTETATFSWSADGRPINGEWKGQPASASEWFDIIENEDKTCVTYQKKAGNKGVVQIKGQLILGGNKEYVFREINLEDKLTVKNGSRLSIESLAARRIVVESTDVTMPAFSATNCLIARARVARGLMQLEYCTVLFPFVAEVLQASDCILLGLFRKDVRQNSSQPLSGCIRYSRISSDQKIGGMKSGNSNCSDQPLFYSKRWGYPGCGVLHPAAPEKIRHGAEDSGEMGAFHLRHYVLAWEAVIQKLMEYLPLGITPVLIPDADVAVQNQ